MLLQIVAAFLATVCFSIMFNTAKNQLIYSGIIGAIGWGVYLICYETYALSIVFSTFFAAMVVNILSHMTCRIRKAPVTVFLVAGIIPLVPGITFYQSIYYLTTEQYDLSLSTGILTFQIAGVIALSVMFGTTLFNIKDRSHRHHLAQSGDKPTIHSDDL
mgnify:CR=1 FL=1